MIEKSRTALADHGFGVLSDIDVSATLSAKLGVEMPAYRILGARNPLFAHEVIERDLAIGVFLPCNVGVRQTGPACWWTSWTGR